MDLIQSAVLAFVQGLTEFLPISSSGHLVLVPKLFGWADQGLAFDVAVHLGSLMAVMLYFRKDVSAIVSATVGNMMGRPANKESKLGWSVLLATIPVGIVGVVLNEWIAVSLRNAVLVGCASMGFGALLWWVDRRFAVGRGIHQINRKDVLVIGCAQAIALIPGVSRSGMTILAGRFMGLQRGSAARFSFLMSIPVIILASGLKSFELLAAGLSIDWSTLLFAMVISAVVAYACIHWFLGFIERHSMAPFAAYLLLLGAFILMLFW
jgi:undecaprenyl-diphosphatase